MVGIARDVRAVGVGEVEVHARGDEGVGRSGADVEAADVVLAAAVDAVEGRGDLAAEAGDRAQRQRVAEDVAAFGVDA